MKNFTDEEKDHSDEEDDEEDHEPPCMTGSNCAHSQ